MGQFFSLGLRVPRDVAARAGLTEGARVDIEGFEDGELVVTRSRRTITLEELSRYAPRGMKPG